MKEEILIEEEEILKQVIEQELHNLDLFNLEVAKYRLQHGMSRKLVTLYANMGRLCRRLMELREHLVGVEADWVTVTRQFQWLLDKGKKGEE